MNSEEMKTTAGLVAALMAVGAILKHAIPKLPNRFIPLILLVLGVPSYVVMVGGNSWTAQNLIMGVGLVAISIGIHSGIKNLSGAGKKLPLLIALPFLLMGTGCTTLNPATGQQEYDPVKTAKVREIIKPVISEATYQGLKETPQLRIYFSQVRDVICAMRDKKQFDPEMLVASLNNVITTTGFVDNPWARIGLHSLTSMYRIYWVDRGRADLPEDKYLWNILDVMCDGINQGLILAPSN